MHGNSVRFKANPGMHVRSVTKWQVGGHRQPREAMLSTGTRTCFKLALKESTDVLRNINE